MDLRQFVITCARDKEREKDPQYQELCRQEILSYFFSQQKAGEEIVLSLRKAIKKHGIPIELYIDDGVSFRRIISQKQKAVTAVKAYQEKMASEDCPTDRELMSAMAETSDDGRPTKRPAQIEQDGDLAANESVEKELLRKQMKLLAERSARCMATELSQISEAMVLIYKALIQCQP